MVHNVYSKNQKNCFKYGLAKKEFWRYLEFITISITIKLTNFIRNHSIIPHSLFSGRSSSSYSFLLQIKMRFKIVHRRLQNLVHPIGHGFSSFSPIVAPFSPALGLKNLTVFGPFRGVHIIKRVVIRLMRFLFQFLPHEIAKALLFNLETFKHLLFVLFHLLLEDG